MLLICYVGSIIQLIFANTVLEGNIGFFSYHWERGVRNHRFAFFNQITKRPRN